MMVMEVLGEEILFCLDKDSVSPLGCTEMRTSQMLELSQSVLGTMSYYLKLAPLIFYLAAPSL